MPQTNKENKKEIITVSIYTVKESPTLYGRLIGDRVDLSTPCFKSITFQNRK
jgi:hypothetical protein